MSNTSLHSLFLYIPFYLFYCSAWLLEKCCSKLLENGNFFFYALILRIVLKLRLGKTLTIKYFGARKLILNIWTSLILNCLAAKRPLRSTAFIVKICHDTTFKKV